MDRGSYRDELFAAQTRAQALERELAAVRRSADTQAREQAQQVLTLRRQIELLEREDGEPGLRRELQQVEQQRREESDRQRAMLSEATAKILSLEEKLTELRVEYDRAAQHAGQLQANLDALGQELDDSQVQAKQRATDEELEGQRRQEREAQQRALRGMTEKVLSLEEKLHELTMGYSETERLQAKRNKEHARFNSSQEESGAQAHDAVFATLAQLEAKRAQLLTHTEILARTETARAGTPVDIEALPPLQALVSAGNDPDLQRLGCTDPAWVTVLRLPASLRQTGASAVIPAGLCFAAMAVAWMLLGIAAGAVFLGLGLGLLHSWFRQRCVQYRGPIEALEKKGPWLLATVAGRVFALPASLPPVLRLGDEAVVEAASLEGKVYLLAVRVTQPTS